MVDSTLKQRLAITKVITSSPTLQSAPASLKIGCDGIVGLRTIVIFYDNERCDLPSHHNHPLYTIANVRKVELKRAMLYPGSSFNSIPYQF